jgi:hypothetical protein
LEWLLWNDEEWMTETKEARPNQPLVVANECQRPQQQQRESDGILLVEMMSVMGWFFCFQVEVCLFPALIFDVITVERRTGSEAAFRFF